MKRIGLIGGGRDPMIKLKRVYENPEKADGLRILVDRLWPRGISREHANIDEWPKEIAPSPQLRKWFGHDPEKWKLFSLRYREELKTQKEALAVLKKKFVHRNATLVYGARDTQHTHAIVLKQVLEKMRV